MEVALQRDGERHPNIERQSSDTETQPTDSASTNTKAQRTPGGQKCEQSSRFQSSLVFGFESDA
jgi:hypothetical protein